LGHPVYIFRERERERINYCQKWNDIDDKTFSHIKLRIEFFGINNAELIIVGLFVERIY
jgi:hypothetical protein